MESVYQQEYPRNGFEILVVDGGSADSTRYIASQFGARVIPNIRRDAEIGKRIGLENSKGDVFLYLDSDMLLPTKNWLDKMIRPLAERSELAGSFTRYVPWKSDNRINRCLSYHPSQCDPALSFFYPVSTDIFAARRSTPYTVYDFASCVFPPIGIVVYRRQLLGQLLSQEEKFMEQDVPLRLISGGHTKFAYVPGAGIVHRTAIGLSDIAGKRLRNIEQVFLPSHAVRSFWWFDPREPKHIARAILFLIYANMIVPAMIVGLVKAVRYRDSAGLMEPAIAAVSINASLLGFLRTKKARAFIERSLVELARKVIT